MTKCILSSYRKDGCSSCTPHCQHKVALEGLDGKSGRQGAAALPEDYQGISIINSPAREGQAKLYRQLDIYAGTFARALAGGEGVKSLYLWSESPGTGKTTTAAALISEWISADYLSALKKGEQPRQFSAYFLDVNQLQTYYNEFNRPRVPEHMAEPAAERYYKSIGRAKESPFTVLDDVGVRDATDGFRADLHSTINHRVTEGKPTVYTSNLPLDEMASVFDERLYDRIRHQTASLHFGGTSKRGKIENRRR